MKFVAIDVETANPDMASICQIGLAKFDGTSQIAEWSTLIDPEDYFDVINMSIHGIDPSMVDGAPTFPEVVLNLWGYLEDSVAVCHTHFDRVAVHQACERYGLKSPPPPTWLDSARVARRAWEEVSRKGYGLSPVCELIGHEFKHHDALEDAKAAAAILLAAMAKTGLGLEEWLTRVLQPIDPNATSSGAIHREGNPEGPLFGEVLVFTGALDIPRREAADLAASLGCRVSTSVSKKTTMLVVGDQDVRRLAGHKKSSKHRKAEQLIGAGAPIRILKESDFKEFARLSDSMS